MKFSDLEKANLLNNVMDDLEKYKIDHSNRKGSIKSCEGVTSGEPLGHLKTFIINQVVSKLEDDINNLIEDAQEVLQKKFEDL